MGGAIGANERILITGGAGFIGSKLIERLAGRSPLRVYDNLSRSTLSVESLRALPQVELVQGDLLDAARLREAAEGCTVLVHAAAIAGDMTSAARTAASGSALSRARGAFRPSPAPLSGRASSVPSSPVM